MAHIEFSVVVEERSVYVRLDYVSFLLPIFVLGFFEKFVYVREC